MWSRLYAIATWVLIVLFGLLAFIHFVITGLYYLGMWDQGIGYFLSFEWPAWLITVVDATAAAMLWFGFRRADEALWRGFALTVGASVLMIGRAAWMVFVPVLIVITIGGSASRVVGARRPAPEAS